MQEWSLPERRPHCGEKGSRSSTNMALRPFLSLPPSPLQSQLPKISTLPALDLPTLQSPALPVGQLRPLTPPFSPPGPDTKTPIQAHLPRTRAISHNPPTPDLPGALALHIPSSSDHLPWHIEVMVILSSYGHGLGGVAPCPDPGCRIAGGGWQVSRRCAAPVRVASGGECKGICGGKQGDLQL